jgi:hypothetical protein
VRHLARGGLLILALLIAACDRQADARAEARSLLTALNAVSDERSLTERASAIAVLDRLPLHEPRHAHTRTVCRAAHQGLLDAEAAQATARRALAAANDGGPPQKLSDATAQAVARNIEASNRALGTAKAGFPQCERALRELLKEAH